MAAYIIYQNTIEKRNLHRISFVLLAFVGIFVGIIFTAIPLIVKFKANVIPFIKDKFAVQNILLPVQWSGFEYLLGLLYILLLIIVLLKLKNNINYINKSKFYGAQLTSGAIFNTTLDLSHPINYGFYKNNLETAKGKPFGNEINANWVFKNNWILNRSAYFSN